MANHNKVFVTYAEASAWAKAIQIVSLTLWQTTPLPPNIPSNPQRSFRAEWTTWGDFLQTGTRANHFVVTAAYDEVSRWAIEHHIASAAEYRRWYRDGRLPAGFPHSPRAAYKGKGWVDWPTFLNRGQRGARSQVSGSSVTICFRWPVD